ncbi:hypothetical protein SacmaDRAFT_3535 [Saccharomonospora marina XMU15]|uniref:Uncharacterized protein n=1 Tax=Saccharomonospora marina XMU15 TaxID=882083 RepID=H5WXU2_9PSEU|nr:hypothetical protein SacmaDRAFT_3535 [Saccharomonospora marina XMU15]
MPDPSSGTPNRSLMRRRKPSHSAGPASDGSQMPSSRSSAMVNSSCRASGCSGASSATSGSSRTSRWVSSEGSSRSRSCTRPKAASTSPRSNGPIALPSPPRQPRVPRSWSSRSAILRSRNIGESRLSRRSSRTGVSVSDSAATAASARSSSPRACGRKRLPSSVSSTVRLLRTNSATPRAFSSLLIRLDSACWLRCSRRAAPVKLIDSAAARNARTCARSRSTTASRPRASRSAACPARCRSAGRCRSACRIRR